MGHLGQAQERPSPACEEHPHHGARMRPTEETGEGTEERRERGGLAAEAAARAKAALGERAGLWSGGRPRKPGGTEPFCHFGALLRYSIDAKRGASSSAASAAGLADGGGAALG